MRLILLEVGKCEYLHLDENGRSRVQCQVAAGTKYGEFLSREKTADKYTSKRHQKHKLLMGTAKYNNVA